MRYIEELSPFYYEKLLKGPFPLEECGELTDEEHALVTTYFADIAGFASWGDRLTSLPLIKKEKAMKYTEKSLLEKHPNLKAKISAVSTPRLFERLQATEEAREFLHSILKELWPLANRFNRPI